MNSPSGGVTLYVGP